MRSRISLTLLICIIGSAIAVGALFLPPRDTAAPPSQTADPGAPAEITIEAFAFSATAPLSPDQELTVVNNDSVPHTLTANDGSFDTGLLQPGQRTVIVVPATAGDYAFFCEVHPSMTGVLAVTS